MENALGILQPEKRGRQFRAKLVAVFEILLAYAVLNLLGIAFRSTDLMKAEVEALGWSYTGMALFVGVPMGIIWLTRRRWADYGVTLVDWQTSLDIGMKAYLVALIPVLAGFGSAIVLHTGYDTLQGGSIIALSELAAIAVMLGVVHRQKPAASGRANIILAGLLLLFPILFAWVMKRLTVLIISTVLWQFVFSGFGEEFVWRGYVQSRLNGAFGRPYCLFGIQFGAGLIIASLLFGISHAFNTFDPATGRYTLAWGWAIWTTFAGLLFGILRERTGSLVACGIAHGLPDAVGESLARVFG